MAEAQLMRADLDARLEFLMELREVQVAEMNQLSANYQATGGAIQDVEYLLGLLDAREAEESAETPAVGDKDA